MAIFIVHQPQTSRQNRHVENLAGDDERIVVGIVESELDPGAAISTVADDASGGTALFIGTVRSEAAVEANRAKPVTQLNYEAHTEMAEDKLSEIATAAVERWGLHRVVALHRTGTCYLGDPTVVVACSAAHRAEALDACRWMIDEIKHGVPIWKQEVYEDGSAWVGGSP
jgi:molybdopterin synthase catalytic subunit